MVTSLEKQEYVCSIHALTQIIYACKDKGKPKGFLSVLCTVFACFFYRSPLSIFSKQLVFRVTKAPGTSYFLSKNSQFSAFFLIKFQFFQLINMNSKRFSEFFMLKTNSFFNKDYIKNPNCSVNIFFAKDKHWPS